MAEMKSVALHVKTQQAAAKALTPHRAGQKRVANLDPWHQAGWQLVHIQGARDKHDERFTNV